ncbi:MAG: hypothetical protein WDN45_11130 [Caulobacteraceae bacterium]
MFNSLQRLQVGAAHTGLFGDVGEGQALRFAQRPKRLPDIRPRIQQRLQP